MLSNREVGELARDLGHTNVAIERTESGRRWVVSCACGYGAPLDDGRPTVTRATFDEAVRTGQHHLRSEVQRYLAGRSRNGLASTGSRQHARGAGAS